MAYQYPLQLNFKLIALAPRIFITDANGQELFYVQQKVLALKEEVRVFSNSQMTEQKYEIKADRIIDFSARYHIRDMAGRELGAVRHRGMRSIWSATYEVYNNTSDQPVYIITEDNPWVKLADALIGEIPVVGMFTGYMFHPTYTAYRGADKESGTPVLKLTKQPAFFESTFTIESVDPTLSGEEETRLLLSLLMMVQMERSRG